MNAVPTLSERRRRDSTIPPGAAVDPRDRIIGDTGPAPGPVVVAIGSVHGNEPAGIQALERIFAAFDARGLDFAGRFIGLRGNMRARRRGRRFITRDLNRSWTADGLAALLAHDRGVAEDHCADQDEDCEQRELLEVLVPLLAAATAPIVFLDLHSSSGEGPPFCCMADVLRNRPIAFGVPVPVILGLEEVIDGALIGYLTDLGHCGVAFEGGPHFAPDTVDNHLAILWCTLVNVGLLDAAAVTDLDAHRQRLTDATAGVPRVIEIRHRHVIQPDDDFVMHPGYDNFQPIARGEHVADDRHGPVNAPEEGLMLLPLYQGQGDDGYFVGRPVNRFWLSVSARLRGDTIDTLFPALPGVRRDPHRPDSYLVDPTIARYRTTEIFHLFGYRRSRSHGELLAFSRRRPDFDALDALPPELAPLLTDRE